MPLYASSKKKALSRRVGAVFAGAHRRIAKTVPKGFYGINFYIAEKVTVTKRGGSVKAVGFEARGRLPPSS